jgi:hypothetical protein
MLQHCPLLSALPAVQKRQFNSVIRLPDQPRQTLISSGSSTSNGCRVVDLRVSCTSLLNFRLLRSVGGHCNQVIAQHKANNSITMVNIHTING